MNLLKSSKRSLSFAFLVIGLFLCAQSCYAELGQATGRISGHSPVISGLIYISGPSSISLNNTHMTYDIPQTAKGIDYSISNDPHGITVTDSDGDALSGVTISGSSAMQVWTTSDGTPIPPADLQQPFYPKYAGKTLLLMPVANVTVTTLTGMPNSATQLAMSNDTPYVLNVPPLPLTVIKDILVNGTTFTPTEGFPATGFSGAKFTIKLGNGIASDFTWASDASWVSVTDGVVTFTGEGDSNKVTVTATPKAGGSPLSYAFTLRTWFINKGLSGATATGADSYCATQPGYATPSYLTMTNAPYSGRGVRAADGRLWDEWGILENYTGSGWSRSAAYWALDPYGSNRYYVDLSDGLLSSYDSSHGFYVACSRTL
ncbi:hypothetical protein [Yersinia intermedia]|uniref:hypothetical protein n=1 Tax=Yersinia intermedia TaxID=631 RepID=UPI0005E62510|nr:hypothetical protein [Yersinia intermedia]CND47835.1 Ig-like domain-containing protein [Yersinia intermedia]